MFFKLVLLFAVLPLGELYLLIQVGQVIGGLSTLALVLVTGVVGAYLARMEGLRVMMRAQANLKNGAVPAEEMIDGLLIFVAGAVLITPGIITDVIGFLILLPFTRRFFKMWLRSQFDHMVASGSVRMSGGFGRGPGGMGGMGGMGGNPMGGPGMDHRDDMNGPGRTIDVDPIDPDADNERR